MKNNPWAILACVVIAFLAGAFLSGIRGGAARARAEEAERVAAELVERSRADSVVMAEMWQAYQDTVAAFEARSTALAAAEAKAEAEARARRADRIALTRKADSLASALSDTATVVPRATFNASREALAASLAENEALGAQIPLLKADRDSWRLLWIQADSGWTAEREAAARLNEALAAQIMATEKWKKAARPSFGLQVLKAIPPAAIGAGVMFLAKGSR